MEKGKKVLIVLTNVNNMQNVPQGQPNILESDTNKTGFDIREVAYLWEFLNKRKNITVTFASPRGGAAPIDPRTMRESEHDETVQNILRDRAVMTRFHDTLKLEDINPEEYCLMVFPGCHGAMFDLPKVPVLSRIAQQIYENNNGYIGALGHGTASFLAIKLKNGEYMVKDCKIACYTNDEEKQKGFEYELPYLLEDKLKEIGAKVEKEAPFKSNVVCDKRILTAQNSCSVKEYIKELEKLMKI